MFAELDYYQHVHTHRTGAPCTARTPVARGMVGADGGGERG